MLAYAMSDVVMFSEFVLGFLVGSSIYLSDKLLVDQYALMQ